MRKLFIAAFILLSGCAGPIIDKHVVVEQFLRETITTTADGEGVRQVKERTTTVESREFTEIID